MKLLLSHIADLDGISPIILLNLLKEDFEYKLFDINDLSKFIEENLDNDYFDSYDEIIITDLGIEEECAEKIINSKYHEKFKLFDHHESRKYLNKYNFAYVSEDVNGFKVCGTTLFYEYLRKNYDFDVLKKNSVITFVELVRENDTWQFTDLIEDAKNLNSLLHFYGRDTFIEMYTEFLEIHNEFYFSEIDLTILKSLNEQKSFYLESMKDKVIIKSVKNYNIGFVFASRYRSELGNYLAHIYEDKVDFICIINMEDHISFRGIKNDKPTNVFASFYGGGGHPLASATDLPSDIKEKIIEYIFGD